MIYNNTGNVYFGSSSLEELNIQGLIYSIQKIVLVILLIFNMKDSKKSVLSYAVVITTILATVISLLENQTLNQIFICIINIYMAFYLFYYNKSFSEKSFRNIIIIITALLIIILCSFLPTIFKKINYDTAIRKLKNIESINSDVSTKTQGLRLENTKETISYSVSKDLKQSYSHYNNTYFAYEYNNMEIDVNYIECDEQQLLSYENDAQTTKITVYNRDFYVVPLSVKSLEIYTRIKGNKCYNIIIIFKNNEISFTEDEMKNLKPLFDVKTK